MCLPFHPTCSCKGLAENESLSSNRSDTSLLKTIQAYSRMRAGGAQPQLVRTLSAFVEICRCTYNTRCTCGHAYKHTDIRVRETCINACMYPYILHSYMNTEYAHDYHSNTYISLSVIALRTDPCCNKVVLDAGLITTLLPEDRQNLIDLFIAVSEGDGRKGARLMIERAKKSDSYAHSDHNDPEGMLSSARSCCRGLHRLNS